MSIEVVKQINHFRNFKYDEDSNTILHYGLMEHDDVENFLEIQYLLDKNRVFYCFERNFNIKILSKSGF